ncbi:MAG: tRNA uridine-5-carboxymethylaminomethyl(34) synthesis enzyme MnmG [Ignavibacteria bacterium]|jgi:tRNA uridine 5-carboxymethylaminomethyl modification enzyme|nr:tRNA uridine-5-carboxymethylaminomethyl(34) synthesis enzyme MnmG [Ignavibacteria bacterium]
MNNKFDVIVVGGGHAGLEAAAVAARLGACTALVTSSFKTICKPSCNPNIGGTAKGHLVKEIDALSGAMGVLADKAGLQFKTLNRSKGPAIWSPRAQIDKDLYPLVAKNYLESLENLTLIEQTASEILVKENKVFGCKTLENETLLASCVILCSGTFLNGKIFIGREAIKAGRADEPAVEHISDLLEANGIKKSRLKTGTPPRIHKDSINYDKVKIEKGDDVPLPFSYKTEKVENKIVCFSSETTEKTHNILRTGFDQSPMFTGLIKGTGPRYCPSIEDKINRFSERNSHKILLEPEGLNTNSIYVNGFSTSLPKEVQIAGLRSIAGLENCEILRYGYAIEYDYFFPNQLKYSLESKAIAGLYFAGQVNGTSGYEEAAGQGMIAGINAVLSLRDCEPIQLKRNEAYIGVLIDDLVNKSTDEPYRMFTSLAEYRLLLRQDNAMERLAGYAANLDLISQELYEKILWKKNTVEQAFEETKNIKLKAKEINSYLEELNDSLITDTTSVYALSKRGKVKLEHLLNKFEKLPKSLANVKNDAELIEKLEIALKYEGYILKQQNEVAYFLENENKRIPENFDYDAIQSISTEARMKLKQIRPISLGQAARISGISATDISMISVYMRL